MSHCSPWSGWPPLTAACAETGAIALAGRKMWLGHEEAVRFTPGPPHRGWVPDLGP